MNLVVLAKANFSKALLEKVGSQHRSNKIIPVGIARDKHECNDF